MPRRNRRRTDGTLRKGRNWAARARCPFCHKVTYASLEVAEADLGRIRLSSVRSKIPQRAYQCPAGMGWHLTALPDVPPQWKTGTG